jgi:hypothetical protein
MIIQKVVKGIRGITDAQAQDILKDGIKSNWLRNVVRTTDMSEFANLLTERELRLHVEDYDNPIPHSHPLYGKGTNYGDITPFISTSAGTNELYGGSFAFYDPLQTAIEFATGNYSAVGYVFYAYLFVLGKKSIIYQQFAEEIREVNIYTIPFQFHYEGEITAKIIIPSCQIEKVEKYDGPTCQTVAGGHTVQDTFFNKGRYTNPSIISNIREIL